MIATNENQQAAASLPQYACHKVVRAARVMYVAAADGAHVVLSLNVGKDKTPLDVTVTQEWYAKHQPQPGGFFVVYAASPGEHPYTSYSPAKAFEEGYVPIVEQPPQGDVNTKRAEG